MLTFHLLADPSAVAMARSATPSPLSGSIAVFEGVKKVIQQTEDFRFVVLPGIHREIEDEEERWTTIAAENKANADHVTNFDPPFYNVSEFGGIFWVVSPYGK